MEIDPITQKKTDKELKKRKIKKSKDQDVTASEVKEKEGFFDILVDTNIKISESELRSLIDNILKLGNNFVKSPTQSNLREYRNSIKDFLKRLEKHWYVIKNDLDFKNATPQLHMVAEVVDDKLMELTDMILKREKNTLLYASKIEEINGLVLDLYK
ncbi:hypothetical protein X927_04660 [Petrotoga mexicana DSM 14811]|uniref:DUF327 domain-containing protein n=1 Tax=Petrotoga mexicana DSM 14811 TaxID=1122954 RepID=A0A2K1PAX4_9BACT|nr:YaaR family protein [Petrotoga mexicana]MDK2906044.1 uncharacterized protein [Petrotoga sp.]PNR99945.1 hypothetical protein X927_04660 [Petrotoga mexicana DSM 14811]